jgi:hypothetical protein
VASTGVGSGGTDTGVGRSGSASATANASCSNSAEKQKTNTVLVAMVGASLGVALLLSLGALFWREKTRARAERGVALELDWQGSEKVFSQTQQLQVLPVEMVFVEFINVSTQYEWRARQIPRW